MRPHAGRPTSGSSPALLLALLLDAVVSAVSATPRAGRWAGAAVGGLLAVVLLLPLVPAWPYASAAADVPAWFTHGARSLPPGTNAVVYPLATTADASSMLWQAMADMDFRMPGGFAVIPGPTGANTLAGQTSPLQTALAACWAGTGGAARLSAQDVRAQLDRWRTRTVAVVPTAPGAACATALFTASLGPARARGRRAGVVTPRLGFLSRKICGSMAAWHTTAHSASPRS